MAMDSLKNTREEGDFRIEEAKPEDVEAIRIIAKNAWLAIYPNEEYGITREDIENIDWFKPTGMERRKKEITEKKDTIHVWVVRDDKNNVVGFCKASKDGHKAPDSSSKEEIDAMYVAPEFQKKGIGDKLIKKAIEWLGADSDIRLEVVSYNSNAINFYKKFGFQETDNKVEYQGTKLPSGKEIPRIEMVKTRAQS